MVIDARVPTARCLRRVCTGLALLAVACAQASAAAPPAVVAVVTDLGGPVQVRRAGALRPLLALDALRSGEQLRLEAGATVEVAFIGDDASVLRLAGRGRYRVRDHDVLPLDAGGVAERRDLAADWRGVRIRPGLVGRASIALRGLPATQMHLRAPIGAQTGAGLARLQWDRPYGRAAAEWDYTVRVIDDQGMLLYTTHSRDLGIELPEELPIDRERDYLWTVQAQADGHRQVYGAAEFRRVSLADEQRVQWLVASVSRLRRDPLRAESSAEEVLLALVLEQSGLQQAAQRQLRDVARVRPALAARASMVRQDMQ